MNIELSRKETKLGVESFPEAHGDDVCIDGRTSKNQFTTTFHVFCVNALALAGRA